MRHRSILVLALVAHALGCTSADAELGAPATKAREQQALRADATRPFNGRVKGQISVKHGSIDVPVAGASVELKPLRGQGTRSTTTANADGRFESQPLAIGNYQVCVSAKGFETLCHAESVQVTQSSPYA